MALFLGGVIVGAVVAYGVIYLFPALVGKAKQAVDNIKV